VNLNTLPIGKAYEKLQSLDPQVSMMHNFFQRKAAAAVLPPPPSVGSSPPLDNSNQNANLHELEREIIAPAEQVNYLSDDWSDDDESSDDSEVEDDNTPLSEQSLPQSTPAQKRRKLDIPVRTARKQRQEARSKELQMAYNDIHKLIHAKKTKFEAGVTGLQSY
jgi:hypothetical protein